MIVKIPLLETYIPLIKDDAKYQLFAFYGGRGGGKTIGITDAHIINALAKKCIQFAGRKIKDANDTSMYLTFKQRLQYFETTNKIPIKCYRIMNEKVIFANGSEIYFKGFNDQTINNIKSSGACSAWIDECETLTYNTIQILIPSIRDGNTKIIFSFNRKTIGDPIFKECISRNNCLMKQINYYNNPYFKENPTLVSLLKEDKQRVEAKKMTIQEYNHIWLGEPFIDEAVMIPIQLIMNSLQFKSETYKAFTPVMGVDVATKEGSDYSIILIRQGNKLIHFEKLKGLDGRDLAQQILIFKQRYSVGAILIDAIGVGTSPCDFLNREFHCQFIPVKFGEKADDNKYFNKRCESYARLRKAFEDGFELINDNDLITQLNYIPFDIQTNDKIKIKPKEEIRKIIGCSPDIADALALTYSYFVNDFISGKSQKKAKEMNYKYF